MDGEAKAFEKHITMYLKKKTKIIVGFCGLISTNFMKKIKKNN
jgi:hypothetical protein